MEEGVGSENTFSIINILKKENYMIPLYNQKEFDRCKSREKLPLKCKQCNKTFYRTKHHIQCYLNPNNKDSGIFCSRSCSNIAQENKIKTHCTNCKKKILKIPAEFKKRKNHFCSRSCAATYNNKHKKHGTRKSKLEK